MAIMILIGKPSRNGDASGYLIEKLSGLELPLAGIARVPYLPGQEIVTDFEKYLGEDGFCYLVSKFELMQALAHTSPAAAEEIKLKYSRLTFLPLEKESCHIISHNSQGVIN